MNDVSIANQEAINRIITELPNLKHDELEHLNHAILALISARDKRMHYLGKFLGLSECGDGYKMQLGMQNENVYGVAQGGAVYTLADVAIGFYLLDRAPEGEKILTQELKMNFIKKGKGDFLYASPNILHWGRKSVVVDCSIKDDDGELVAHALGTFYRG